MILDLFYVCVCICDPQLLHACEVALIIIKIVIAKDTCDFVFIPFLLSFILLHNTKF